jgi:SAM-dependent methyltransferase
VVGSPQNCPLCGADDSSLVHQGVRYDEHAVVRRCRRCDLVYLTPQPAPEALAEYYAKVYRDRVYEEGFTPEQAYQEQLPEARARVERLRRLLDEQASVLELGCSSGAFLEAVRPYAGTVTGIEPGHTHREWAANTLALEVHADLDSLGDRRFDRIVLFHVLEHVIDPVGYLASLLRRLNPGGLVVIEVPNVDDALVSLYAVPAYQPFYWQKAHLCYFSAATLRSVVERAGGLAEITGVQRYDLSNHLRWMLSGAPGGQGFYRSVLGAAADAAYREALVQAGRADTLWAVVQANGLSQRS